MAIIAGRAAVVASDRAANQPLSSAITKTATWRGEADKKDTAVGDRERVFFSLHRGENRWKSRSQGLATGLGEKSSMKVEKV